MRRNKRKLNLQELTTQQQQQQQQYEQRSF